MLTIRSSMSVESSPLLRLEKTSLREQALTALRRAISAGQLGRLSVRYLDAKEIKDIFNVRAALESLAARELCAKSDRGAAVQTLRAAVEDMEKWAASNLEDRIEADLNFHRTMCHLT